MATRPDDAVRLRPIARAAAAAQEPALRRSGTRKLPAGPKAQRTRRRIMDAARRMFAERGYVNTTVADIVDEVGISFGAFYQYFRERADVVSALLQEHIAERQSRDDGPWDATGGWADVHRIVSGFVSWYAENADFTGVWEEVCHVDGELAEMRRDLGRVMTEAVEAELMRGVALGRLRPMDGAEAALAARALTAMIDRFCYVTYVFDPPAEGPPEPDEASRVLTELWVGAIGLRRRPMLLARPDGRGPVAGVELDGLAAVDDDHLAGDEG